MTEQQALWSVDETTSIKSYTLGNFRTIPQIQQMSEETQFEMEVVGNVLPFKTNNYVVEQLIDWDNIPNDPMYVLTFPQKGMLIVFRIFANVWVAFSCHGTRSPASTPTSNTCIIILIPVTNPIAKKASIAVRANLDICGRV